jgi:hypothetical protein
MCGRSSAARPCETITPPPASFHAIARGCVTQPLLAMMLVIRRL